MLYTDIAVVRENHTAHRQCGQNAERLLLNLVPHTALRLKVNGTFPSVQRPRRS